MAAVGFLYLQQYATVEAAHRDFLRTAIAQAGATPVPANPKGYSAGLASGTDLKTTLPLIRTVEETGVTAYFGAVGFLTNALGNNWVADAKALFDFGFADTNNLGKPALTRLQTVQLVYASEQTGVSAYLGGAGPGGLTPGGKYLSIAASILRAEARHTAAVAILLNGPTFDETPKLATAPLVTPTVKDVGTGGGLGLDMALAPDAILNMGGLVAADTTVAGDGKINPISGPNGFVFVNA